MSVEGQGNLGSGWERNGRGGEIRTHDLLYPKQARYQATLRPEPKRRRKCPVPKRLQQVFPNGRPAVAGRPLQRRKSVFTSHVAARIARLRLTKRRWWSASQAALLKAALLGGMHGTHGRRVPRVAKAETHRQREDKGCLQKSRPVLRRLPQVVSELKLPARPKESNCA